MPKKIDDCVKAIKGINKRTGKPYTEDEKWAICTAQHQKGKVHIYKGNRGKK